MYSFKLALLSGALLIGPLVPTQTGLQANTAVQTASYDKPEGQTQPQIASYDKPEGQTQPQIASYDKPEGQTQPQIA